MSMSCQDTKERRRIFVSLEMIISIDKATRSPFS